MIKIDEDDDFNRSDKKIFEGEDDKLKSEDDKLKIYKLTKSVILVKPIIYKKSTKPTKTNKNTH